MTILGFAMASLLGAQEPGLPVEFPVTLAEPFTQPDARPLPSEPIGRWACAPTGDDDTEDSGFIVTIRPLDRAHYAVSLADSDPSVPSSFVDRPAHLSREGAVSVLNINVGSSEERAENYWVARLRTANGTLDLDFIGDGIRLPQDPERSWVLVRERIEESKLYALRLHCSGPQRP